MSDSLRQNFVETANGRICYFSNHDFPERPTVVLLHGLGSNHLIWSHLSAELHKAQYNIIAPDIRGHGYSDKRIVHKLYTFPVLADDVAAIAKKENLSQCILAGYSFGGTIALEYASRYGQTLQGLILIGVNHRTPYVYWKIPFLNSFSMVLVNTGAALSRLLSQKTFTYYDPKTARGYWHSTLEGFKAMPIPVNLWLLAELGKSDYREALTRMRFPVSLITAAHDPFVTEQEIDDMLRALPNAMHSVIDNDSHFVATEAEEKTARFVVDFVNTLPRT